MLNKFRLSHFLLGLGIGIILTNTIYIFNPKIIYKEYTEDEIISSAMELGMVFVKDNIDISNKEELKELNTDIEGEMKNEITLVVKSGDSLEEVSNKLFELGVVEDGQGFHKFAKEKDVEKKIRVGTYKLDSNMNYETIIKIITKSP